ncbi:extradiol ring-cleavage dioxygenase, partial [Magnaporthiopsis poae ATCC 64411]
MLWGHCQKLVVSSSIFGRYIASCPATAPSSSSSPSHLHPCQQQLCQASALVPHPRPPAMPRGVVIALSHGGGPMPLLGHPDSAQMTKSMRERVPEILRLDDPDPARRPAAIVLVTAHWVAPPGSFPSITSGANPDLIFDYYGFPPESYEFKYP